MPLPLIDLSAPDAARHLRAACIGPGFFYALGHGVDPERVAALSRAARAFFALPEAEKLEVAMPKAGPAWRGYFPVGGELTSGRPDHKEGLYFGAEHDLDHPRVRAGTPMHGPNQWPASPAELRALVTGYMEALTALGHRIMRVVAASLGLPERWFEEGYTRDPLVLFRVFHYPPPVDGSGWGVGVHTDYGLLTILHQDEVGGLEVKTPAGWVEAPPVPDSFVCNIGDMLDRATGGLYRSTPHRVRSAPGRSRLSMPFFFDPGWDARLVAIPGFAPSFDDVAERWDGASVHAFAGSYGDYLLRKVRRVFPDLSKAVPDY